MRPLKIPLQIREQINNEWDGTRKSAVELADKYKINLGSVFYITNYKGYREYNKKATAKWVEANKEKYKKYKQKYDRIRWENKKANRK